MTTMDRRTIKFLIGSVIIVGAIAWLGFSGFNESLAYYKTVDELKQMKDDAFNKRLRVAGNIVNGSIERVPGSVNFKLEQKGVVLPICYVGKELLPDTHLAVCGQTATTCDEQKAEQVLGQKIETKKLRRILFVAKR